MLQSEIRIGNWHSTEDDLENHENRIPLIHLKQYTGLVQEAGENPGKKENTKKQKPKPK